MVPRGSLPAITSACSQPGMGFLTRVLAKASHFPVISRTLSAPDLMRLSMTVEWPMVPAMMIVLPGEGSAYCGPVKLLVLVVEYTVLFLLLTGL